MTDTTQLRVLVADDHEPTREMLEGLLRHHPGVTFVGAARDGLEAVRLALESRPDVVLMDLGMPELNGLEATRRIKAIEPRIKVLVVTVHDERSYLQAATAAGADAYLVKKDLPARLASVLEAVAAGSRQ